MGGWLTIGVESVCQVFDVIFWMAIAFLSHVHAAFHWLGHESDGVVVMRIVDDCPR